LIKLPLTASTLKYTAWGVKKKWTRNTRETWEPMKWKLFLGQNIVKHHHMFCPQHSYEHGGEGGGRGGGTPGILQEKS
jgi:hypothetical protein